MRLSRYALGCSLLLTAVPVEAQVDYARADMIRLAQSRIQHVPDFTTPFAGLVGASRPGTTR